MILAFQNRIARLVSYVSVSTSSSFLVEGIRVNSLIARFVEEREVSKGAIPVFNESRGTED